MTKPQKETILSVLKEIRDDTKAIRQLLKANNTFLAHDDIKKPEDVPPNMILVDFPSLTAKEIMDSCDNKTKDGKPLWNTGWYKDAHFFTTEKTRKGKRYVSLELLHKGKSFTECKAIAEKEGKELLNVAEVVYLLKNCKPFREMLKYDRTWTSSLSPGGRVVRVGAAVANGADLLGWDPQDAFVDLGFSFSCGAKLTSVR